MAKTRNKKKMKETKLNKFDNKINSLIDSLIPAIMLLVPIIFILYVLNIHGYLFPKGSTVFQLNYFYQFVLYILAGIYIYKVIIKKVIITKSDIFLFIFMFFTILSTIFANNHNVALYGYPNRYEGMFTLLFYCFLYLDCKLLSSDVDVKYLIKIMISVSIIHLIVVITQLTGTYEKIIYMYTSGNAIGLTENCNFLGSLMCLISAISISGYLLHNKQEKSYYYLFITIISYITLLLANSSGPFISLIVTFIILLIVLSIKKRIDVKKVVIVSILLITLYPICLSKRDEITPEIKSNIKIILNLFNNKEESSKLDSIDDNSDNNSYQPNVRDLGNGRIKIWKNVWSLIKEKPILGYGPDNLGLVYEKGPYDTKNADKAHNIYLHIFVSSGLFAVIGYVLWISYTIYLGLKSKNNTILILCFGIIAYSIQGFFNINVIEVCPYFYLTVGFMMLLVKENKIILSKNN